MKNKLISLPCMETPIRCYVTFANTNHQLSCNPTDGTIFTTKGNRKEWEEWNLIPDGTSTGYYIIQQKMSSRILTISDDADDGFNLISTTTLSSEQQNHSLWIIELYKLESEHVQYTIRSAAYNDYYLCASTKTQNEQTNTSINPKCLQLLNGTQVENHHLVNIEYLTGELCFFSSPAHEKRLSCNPYGGLSMSSNWKGWEVFRIVEVGNDHHVRIMSWTHDTKVLYSDPEGKVLMGENKLGSWEKWIIELAPEPYYGVIVKSVDHGSYLCYDGNDLKTSIHIDASAVWDISTGHRQRYYISSISHDRRMGCDNGKGQIFCTTNRKDWEVWKMDSLERGMVSFQSDVNGKKYLGCDEEGNIKASDTVGKDEKWKIKESSHGGFFVISDSGWYLACDGKGIYASNNSQGWESWSLEPVMPSTMTGNQIKGYAIGGAVALASVVLMPFAVMGAVGALGFTAEGIAGGSIAAGMMSAEAIASGGGVIAGGTVATLQSIGAAGLGAGGVAAAMGAGGAIGAAAIGISTIVTAEKNKSVKEGEMQVDENLLNRPFSSWKSWS